MIVWWWRCRWGRWCYWCCNFLKSHLFAHTILPTEVEFERATRTECCYICFFFGMKLFLNNWKYYHHRQTMRGCQFTNRNIKEIRKSTIHVKHMPPRQPSVSLKCVSSSRDRNEKKIIINIRNRFECRASNVAHYYFLMIAIYLFLFVWNFLRHSGLRLRWYARDREFLFPLILFYCTVYHSDFVAWLSLDIWL